MRQKKWPSICYVPSAALRQRKKLLLLLTSLRRSNAPLGVSWSHPYTAARTPTWGHLFVEVATVQPSSCSVERLFSAAKHVLSPLRANSLPDLIRYNVVRYFNRDI